MRQMGHHLPSRGVNRFPLARMAPRLTLLFWGLQMRFPLMILSRDKRQRWGSTQKLEGALYLQHRQQIGSVDSAATPRLSESPGMYWIISHNSKCNNIKLF